MESKKINQLATEMSPAISDLTIIGDPITGVSKKITLLQIADLFQTTGTVTSVAVTETGDALSITGSPITTAGTINIGFAGSANQYVRGDGALAPFPTTTGGGSSVSYYLNGSVNQGTFGGSTYYQMSKDAVIGVGTNFSTSSNGLIAQFITDANDPDVVQIPSGNWNIEFFMNVSSSSGALASFYVEIYKYNGSTFTLLATNSATPEQLTNTTTVDAYYTSVAMPTSALSVTDRLAIRIYANVASKTVTLYTEDNRLCQVVTTFSKGMSSLNNLTDQSQFLATGTSGTDFAIVSSGDTHTFNLPVASATNTGKLSNTDWSTFNNKQNALTNPITGLGASGNVAYFDSASSITSENSFNYDASTNRLGVNTSVPNATIGANAGIDSGYSLLLKNDNANYNGIGFATDSTYGNLIATEKLGTALTRNLTLLNQSGYVSLTEAGNFGVNILNPNTGVDIYNGSNAYLWLHTANSGITGTDGVRLALFSTNGANLRNFDGSFSITAEGDFSVITLGAENFKINSADGSIYQSKVANAMLKSVSGVITAAVAGTDYVLPSALTGYVPTSRTLTINGTAYDLSADRSWTVGTMGGSGVSGRVAYYDGTNSITSEAGFIYDASTNRLGVNTSVPNATIGGDAALDSGYGLLIKTGASNYNGIGIAIDSTYGNLISTEKLGTASARNLTLLNQSGFVSLTESGNLGLNVLTPAVSGNGIDIYGSTSVGLRFHTATSGTTVSDGAGINFSAANNLGITNYENGTIDIVTNGNSGVFVASNGFVGINGATPSVALTVNGGAAISNLTTGQILFPTSGGTLSGSSSLFWDNTNAKLGIGTTTLSTSRVTITSTSEASHLHLVANAPALTFTNALSFTYYAGIGMATASNNFVTGAVQGDLALGAFNTSSILFFNNNTNTMRMSLNGSGAAIFSGSVTARGPKSQIVVDGNSVGAGISLTNTIVGVNRRNWGIFTEQDAEGDFVIKRSTVSGGDAQSGTTILSLLNTGAATFSSSVTALSLDVISSSGVGSSSASGLARFITAGTTTAISVGQSNSARRLDIGSQSIKCTGDDFYLNNGGANATIFENNGSERMRITSGGNVGIGTSNPSKRLVVSNDGSNWISGVFGGAGGTDVTVIGNLSGGGTIGGHNSTLSAWANMYIYGTNLIFGSGGDTERMRITSDSKVLMGTTTYGGVGNSFDNGGGIIVNYSGTGFRTAVEFKNNNGTIGSITCNGSSTTYNTTSDYRLKEDLKEINGLEKVSAIRVYDFKWKGIEDRMDGVLAHELADVIPYAVQGQKDDEQMQSVDYSKIVPILIKSIQELQAKIVTLESKIN